MISTCNMISCTAIKGNFDGARNVDVKELVDASLNLETLQIECLDEPFVHR